MEEINKPEFSSSPSIMVEPMQRPGFSLFYPHFFSLSLHRRIQFPQDGPHVAPTDESVKHYPPESPR